jgi:hypothetical protein
MTSSTPKQRAFVYPATAPSASTPLYLLNGSRTQITDSAGAAQEPVVAGTTLLGKPYNSDLSTVSLIGTAPNGAVAALIPAAAALSVIQPDGVSLSDTRALVSVFAAQNSGVRGRVCLIGNYLYGGSAASNDSTDAMFVINSIPAGATASFTNQVNGSRTFGLTAAGTSASITSSTSVNGMLATGISGIITPLTSGISSAITGTIPTVTGISVRGAQMNTSCTPTITTINAISATAVISADRAAYGTVVGIDASAGSVSSSTVSTLVSALRCSAAVAPAGTPANATIQINGAASGATGNYGLWIKDNTASAAAGVVLGFSADASFWRGAANQLLTQGDWSTRHYLSSSTPTVAAGAGAGTSPTISIAGTDHGFTVTLTQGNPSATGTVFTVTWGASWTTSAPAVTVSPGNASTAALSGTSLPYISAVSTTTMTFTSGSVALTAATAYIFRFTAMR